jgi:NTP pyrophosphatase (non-canonical NTP hydrolase)
MVNPEERTALRETVFHLHPVFSEYCGTPLINNDIYCTDSRHATCPTCRKNIDGQTLQAGDNFTFNFPRTIYADRNGIATQSEHIYSEALEVKQAVLTPDIFHTAEEIMDTLHSCETALRILRDKYGININEVREFVEAKNKERNYYAEA